MSAPEELVETVDAALALAQHHGRDDLVARLGRTRDRFTDDRVRVLVIGEFKQGKSQLVNALVRAQVCPVDDDIATSVPTAVRWAEQPTVSLVREVSGERGPDGEPAPPTVERREVSMEALAGHVAEAGNPGNREGLALVEVGIPAKLLAQGLELVDTPGVGGLGSIRATTTLAALAGADAVLLVSDAAQEFTAAELEFLAHAVKLCPNLACVLTKVDLYPEWRRIQELNQGHLLAAGIEAKTLPVSSVLRWLALERNDNGLNVESGFPALAEHLNDIVYDAEAVSCRAVANSVLGVTEQLATTVATELAAAENPASVSKLVGELNEAKARMAALRDRSARWSQTLTDGVADLSGDIEYDLRDRMREIVRNAEEEIELLGDPAVVWVEFAPWMAEQVAAATSANFVWAHERSRWLAEQVAAHFAEEGRLDLPSLRLAPSSPTLADLRPIVLGGEEDPSLGEQALTAIRGGYVGALMFGMFSTVAGMALLNPFSVGAGLLLGQRSVRDEKKRHLSRRQTEAKNAVRRYADDVVFHVGKDSRDLLRDVSRQLRDHFTALATEVETSLREQVRVAEDAARADSSGRDARVAKLREHARAIAAVQRSAMDLRPVAKTSLAKATR
ncbi:MAG: dynamin family protein [Sporichthyaceae bacterium]